MSVQSPTINLNTYILTLSLLLPLFQFPNIRKWPLDYHSVLYTKESTPKTTYIDIGALDDALGDMWGTKLQNGPELGFPVKDTN